MCVFLLREGKRVKFAFIHVEKAQFPVAVLCRLFDVTRQGYYAPVSRPPCARKLEDAALLERVLDVHKESRETYGSPRIRKELQHNGFAFSKRRIERAMKTLGIVGPRRRRFKATTMADAAYKHPPNSLARDFAAAKPNQRWVTAITYVHTHEGWCYLATIIDLFSRAVVGWALDTTLETKLPLAALDTALKHRRPSTGLLRHSDRGCRYTSFEYQGLPTKRGIEVSMSRKGQLLG